MTILEPRVYQRNKSILLKINSSNKDNIHILYQPILVPTQLNPIEPTFNGFIQDLRAKIEISALEQVEFPNLEPELTQAERLMEYTLVEWNNSRYELELLKSNDGVNWIEIARVSLQNRLPYYSVDLLPFFTKQADAIVGDEWIACRIKDAGFGSLSSADEVVIFGSMQLQAHYFVGDTSSESALPTPAVSARNFKVTLTEQSQLVAAANPDRKALIITMTGSGRGYFSLGSPAVEGEGIFLNGRGSTLTLDYSNQWLGEVHGKSSGNGVFTYACSELV